MLDLTAKVRKNPTLEITQNGRYTIQPGDTLNAIAARLLMRETKRTPTMTEVKAKAGELAEINDIENPNQILAGNTLRLERPDPFAGAPDTALAERTPEREAELLRENSALLGDWPEFGTPDEGDIVISDAAEDEGEELTVRGEYHTPSADQARFDQARFASAQELLSTPHHQNETEDVDPLMDRRTAQLGSNPLGSYEVQTRRTYRGKTREEIDEFRLKQDLERAEHREAARIEREALYTLRQARRTSASDDGSVDN
ncbi:MAG: LysM peptidoglycan-binding domain-containing protein [Candidatus Margulisbacteria bacterium]|nr:LysM peptidoglycan-binding domain-containing protein [Candidatus Margulisiibacteriota bacterium]MBU1954625.1 LysM peptidoglycan-binding domain-containing protein [Candidatus Margulisiibacteriota bacterium]